MTYIQFFAPGWCVFEDSAVHLVRVTLPPRSAAPRQGRAVARRRPSKEAAADHPRRPKLLGPVTALSACQLAFKKNISVKQRVLTAPAPPFLPHLQKLQGKSCRRGTPVARDMLQNVPLSPHPAPAPCLSLATSSPLSHSRHLVLCILPLPLLPLLCNSSSSPHPSTYIIVSNGDNDHQTNHYNLLQNPVLRSCTQVTAARRARRRQFHLVRAAAASAAALVTRTSSYMACSLVPSALVKPV